MITDWHWSPSNKDSFRCFSQTTVTTTKKGKGDGKTNGGTVFFFSFLFLLEDLGILGLEVSYCFFSPLLSVLGGLGTGMGFSLGLC